MGLGGLWDVSVRGGRTCFGIGWNAWPSFVVEGLEMEGWPRLDENDGHTTTLEHETTGILGLVSRGKSSNSLRNVSLNLFKKKKGSYFQESNASPRNPTRHVKRLRRAQHQLGKDIEMRWKYPKITVNR